MEYQDPKVGVILYDVSDESPTIQHKLSMAKQAIGVVYPDAAILSPDYWNMNKCDRVGKLISQMGAADTLFCNTCGDEVDHLYRFVRAIAKNEGLQIIPMREIYARAGMEV